MTNQPNDNGSSDEWLRTCRESKMNTGRIQDKLRDPVRLKNWWDQYALEAADYIDRLETEIDALKTQRTLERIDQAKQREQIMMDRDNAWNAFQRLRKAYAMVRYPTLNEEIKLLYDTADAVAYGKDTSGDGGQNPTVTPVKPPART